MDVLSLPEELIAGICKFFKFETITRLRKYNVQIDNAIVRYGLSKPIIASLEAKKNELRIVYRTADMYEKPQKRAYMCQNKVGHMTIRLGYIFLKCSDTLPMLETKLKETRPSIITFCSLNIDEKWLDPLDKVNLKHRIVVEFKNCNFETPMEDLKNVVSEFKSVEFAISTKSKGFEGDFETDNVICSLLPWAKKDFSGNYEATNTFTDVTDTIIEVFLRHMPKKFCIGNNFTSFTIPKIIQTMKAYITYGDKRTDWDFGRVRANTQLELLRTAEELKTIKGFKIKEHPTHIEVSAGNVFSGYKVVIDFNQQLPVPVKPIRMYPVEFI